MQVNVEQNGKLSGKSDNVIDVMDVMAVIFMVGNKYKVVLMREAEVKQQQIVEMNESALYCLTSMHEREELFKPVDRTVYMLAGFSQLNTPENRDKILNNIKMGALSLLGCTKFKVEFEKTIKKRFYTHADPSEMKSLGITEQILQYEADDASNNNIFMYEAIVDHLKYRVLTLPLGFDLLNQNGEIAKRRAEENKNNNQLEKFINEGKGAEEIQVRRQHKKEKQTEFKSKAVAIEKQMANKIFTMKHVCQCALKQTKKYSVVFFLESKDPLEIEKEITLLKSAFSFSDEAFSKFFHSNDDDDIDENDEKCLGGITRNGKVFTRADKTASRLVLNDRYFTENKQDFANNLFKIRLPDSNNICQNEELTYVLMQKTEKFGSCVRTAVFALAPIFGYIQEKEFDFQNKEALNKTEQNIEDKGPEKERIPILTFRQLFESVKQMHAPFLQSWSKNKYTQQKLSPYFTEVNFKVRDGWNIIVEKDFPVVPLPLRGLLIMNEYNVLLREFNTEIVEAKSDPQRRRVIEKMIKDVLSMLMNPNSAFDSAEDYFDEAHAPVKLQEYFNFVLFLFDYVSKAHEVLDKEETFLCKIKDLFPRFTTTPEQIIGAVLKVESNLEADSMRTDYPDHFYTILLRIIQLNEMNTKELVIGFKIKLKFKRVTRVIGDFKKKRKRGMQRAIKDGEKIVSVIHNLYEMLEDKEKLADGSVKTIGFDWLDIDKVLGSMLELVNEHRAAFFIHRKFDDHERMQIAALCDISLMGDEEIFARCIEYGQSFIEVNEFEIAKCFFRKAYSNARNTEEEATAKHWEDVKENSQNDIYEARKKRLTEEKDKKNFTNLESCAIPQIILDFIKKLQWNEALEKCLSSQ